MSDLRVLVGRVSYQFSVGLICDGASWMQGVRTIRNVVFVIRFARYLLFDARGRSEKSAYRCFSILIDFLGVPRSRSLVMTASSWE